MTGQPQIGDRFNPWQRWNEELMPYPPATVWRQPGLDLGPKALYMQLFHYAGKTGFCWPGTNTLAEDLGVTEKSIDRWLVGLENHKLICHERRAGRRGNTYYFLWHEIFDGTTLSRQRNLNVPPRRDIRARLKGHKHPFEGTTLSQESLNHGITPLNHDADSVGGLHFSKKENESSSSEQPETMTTMTPSLSVETQTQNADTGRLREILNKYRDDWWKKTLRAPLTPERLLSFQKLGRTPDEIGMALETKANTLMDKPVETWHYVQKVVKTYFETESPEAAGERPTRTLGDRAQPAQQILEAEVVKVEPLEAEPDYMVNVLATTWARNGGYRGEAMAGWIIAHAGPEVKKSELQAWQERAHAALGHCPKCEDRGCAGYNLTPCDCAWAIGLGYRKPSPEELAEAESEVWL